jgi:hypothetical protein
MYNFVYFKKLGPHRYPSPENALFVCLANIEGGKIQDFRLAFAGAKAFRHKDREMFIAGRKTSSPAKEVQTLVDDYAEAFGADSWYDSRIFVSLLEECFGRLFS